MKNSLRVVVFAVLGVACAGLVRAGDYALAAVGDRLELRHWDAGQVMWSKTYPAAVEKVWMLASVRYVYCQMADGRIVRTDLMLDRVEPVPENEAVLPTNVQTPIGSTCTVADWRWPIAAVPVTDADRAKMDAAIMTAALARPAVPRRVLLLAFAFGYSHNEALSFGGEAFRRAAVKTSAFSLDVTTDVGVLTDRNRLAQYDAIVLDSVTSVSERDFPGLGKTLTGYVSEGKGLVLLHAAVDSFKDALVVQELCGGCFFGHPWPAEAECRFVVEGTDHPINVPFGGVTRFRTADEIYMQKPGVCERSRCHVLVSLDTTDETVLKYEDMWRNSTSPGAKRHPVRADRDFIVSWVKRYGSGRVFYTSFGHDRRAFLDVRFAHMLRGLQYALGDLVCEDGCPARL